MQMGRFPLQTRTAPAQVHPSDPWIITFCELVPHVQHK